MNARDTFRWDNWLSNRVRQGRRAHRQARGPRPRPLRIEALEDRRLLADTVAHWIGGSGNWSDRANWDIGVVPNNAGSTHYSVVIDSPSANPTITVDGSVTVDALTNAEAIHVTKGSLTVSTQADNGGVLAVKASSATLVLSGNVSNVGDLLATAGTLRLANAIVASSARTITADGGIVEIKDSTISGGSLRATDNAASFVQFSGNVTLNGVPWEDSGAGEFRVYNTTAKLLGDYAEQLPAGYTLAVVTKGKASQLTLAGGVFTNNGTICLKEIYNSIQISPRLFLESDTTLAGSGQVSLASDQSLIQGVAGTTLTIGADQRLHGAGGYSSGGIALPVVNHGLIEADATFQFNTLKFQQSVVNHGTMRATGGGTLEVLGATTNLASVEIAADSAVSLLGGLHNHGTIDTSPRATLTLGGTIDWDTNLTATLGATLRLSNTVYDNSGRTIIAAGGIVELQNATVTGGTLRATDDPASFLQFNGNVTLNGVTWDDPGEGEFRVYQTTAQLLGDYGHHLPLGYTLVVDAGSPQGRAAALNILPGVFENDGTIELRGGYTTDILGQNSRDATMALADDTSFEGTGLLVLSGEVGFGRIVGPADATLTIGSDQSLRGYHGGVSVAVVSHGAIHAEGEDSNGLAFKGLTNYGTLGVRSGAELRCTHLLNYHIIDISSGGHLEVKDSRARSRFDNQGELLFRPGSQLSLWGDVSTRSPFVADRGSTLWFYDAVVSNTGQSITANGGTVSFSFGSTINGGILRVTDEPLSVVAFNDEVTFDGVIWEDPGAGEFQIRGAAELGTRLLGDFARHLPAGYTVVVSRYSKLKLPEGTFTNDGRIELHEGYLGLDSSTILDGAGSLHLSDWSSSVSGPSGAVLTIGPEQTLSGTGYIDVDVVNQGKIGSDSQPFRGNSFRGNLTNRGEISGGFSVLGDTVIDDPGTLGSGFAGFYQDVLGNTRNVAGFGSQLAISLTGSGTSSSPLLFEVMAQDYGTAPRGEGPVPVLDALQVGPTYVRLVDFADNAPGDGAEALYVRRLTVLTGSTLDLNGLQLYAGAAQIEGTVVNGTVRELPIGPRITGHKTAGSTVPFVESLTLTFDRDMDRTSFSREDIVRFDGPQGALEPSAYSWNDARNLTVTFPRTGAIGRYEMAVGPNIGDIAGHLLDQDQDFAGGEPVDDQYTGAFDITPPKVVSHTPSGITPDAQEKIRIIFDRPMAKDSFSLAEDVVGFAGPGGEIAVESYSWVNDRALEFTFATRSLRGDYALVLGRNVLDLAGNALPQEYTAAFRLGYLGTLNNDTTWTPENGVIVVDGMLTVASGVSLTVEEGTVVKFANDQAGLTVAGVLTVRGTPLKPVVFTSLLDDAAGGDTNGDDGASLPNANDWAGLKFTNSVTDSSMTGTVVRYAHDGVVVGDGSSGPPGRVRLIRSVLELNETAVVAATRFGDFTAEECLIVNNVVGIEGRGNGRVSLRHATVVGNGWAGELGQPDFRVVNSIFAFNANGFRPYFNAAYGIYFSPSAEDLEIWNSDFLGASADMIVDALGEIAYRQNANISLDPRLANWRSGDYELSANSPCIDAGTGSRSSDSDALARSRHDDVGMPNVGTGYPSFVDMGALERQQDTLAADLGVVKVTEPAPKFVRGGEPFRVEWMVMNLGVIESTGGSEDAVYLSTDPHLSSDDSLIVRRTHNGPLVPGETYTESFAATAPAAAGAYYVLVRTTPLGAQVDAVKVNNVLASSTTLGVDLPLLTPATPVSGALRQSEWTYVRYVAAAQQSVIISLDVAEPDAATSLHVRYATAPTLNAYDVRAEESVRADQELRLLSPSPGDYYIGIFGDSLPGGSSAYTLTASVPTLSIRAVSPDNVSNAGRATLRINGDSFDPAAQVQLVYSDGTLLEAQEVYQDESTVFAQFDLASLGAAVGSYAVVVVNPDGTSAAHADAVNVTAAAVPQFRASLKLPALTRPGRVVDIRIDYANPGLTDVPSPLLTLDSGTSDTEWQLTGRDTWVQGPQFQLLGLSSTGPATTLRAGQQESVVVSLRVPFRPEPVTVDLLSVGATSDDGSGSLIDWTVFEQEIIPDDVDPADWTIAFSALRHDVGPTWGHYVDVLRRTADRWAAAGVRNPCVRGLFESVLDAAFGRPSLILSGEVVDAASGVPATGVRVVLDGLDNPTHFEGRSDAYGRFFFYGATSGTYRAAIPEYLVESGAYINVLPQVDRVDVQLDVGPGGTINGIIRRSDVAPFNESAIVEVVNSLGEAVAVSAVDPRGRFHFRGLAPTTYIVRCRARGYAEAMSEVSIADVAEAATLEFNMVPAATISGRVTRKADGAPLSEAYVEVLGTGLLRTGVTLTDRNGDYQLPDLSADTYTIRVTSDGYIPQRAEGISLSIGQMHEALNFSLATGAVVEGTILDSQGFPIPDANVVAVSSRQEPVATVTDSEGKYSIRGLCSGEHTIRASYSGLAQRASVVVVLSDGEEVTDIDIRLETAGGIGGTVVSSVSGGLVAGVTAVLVGDSLDFADNDPAFNGQYEITDVAPGTYDLIVRAPGFRETEVSNVVIDGGVTFWQQVTVDPTGEVYGRVTNGNTGLPLCSVRVEAWRDGIRVRSGVTDSAGWYKIDDLESGTYDLVVRGTGTPGATTAIPPGGRTGADLVVDVIASVSGTIRAADGATTAAGVTVFLTSGSSVVTNQTTVDDGNFLFYLRQPGVYGIYATDQTSAYESREYVTVATGDNLKQLDLVAGREVIAGSVLRVDAQQPVGGADVFVELLGANGLAFDVGHITTDDLGRFTFPSAATGKYRVTVAGVGLATEYQTQELQSDGSTSFQFLMGASAHLTGEVISTQNGDAVAAASIVLISPESHDSWFTLTDSDGQWHIDTIPPGTYDLQFVETGFVRAVMRSVVVTPNDNHVTAALSTSLTRVSGNVVDLSGNGLRGAVVTAYDDRGYFSGQSLTDSAGAYTLDTLALETYGLVVDLEGFLTQSVATPVISAGENTISAIVLEAVAIPDPAPQELFSDLDPYIPRYPPRLWRLESIPSPKCADCGALAQRAHRQFIEWEGEDEAFHSALQRYDATDKEKIRKLEEGLRKAAFAMYPPIGVGTGLYDALHSGNDLDALRGVSGAVGSVAQLDKEFHRVGKVWAKVNRGKVPPWLGGMKLTTSKLIGGIGWAQLIWEIQNTLPEILRLRGDLAVNMSEVIRLRNICQARHDEFKATIEQLRECNQSCNKPIPLSQGMQQSSHTMAVSVSTSPEDQWGPAGYDPPGTLEENKQRFVAEGQVFEYRIEMWNKPEAAVPTQDATIYDYLDPQLFDLSTFEFTRVGFLKWDQPLPGGQTIHTRIDCRPEMNIAVDITGTLDPATGRIDWWFHTVDPLTGDYPENPNDGFLPPFNPETGFEIGWMEYRVKPKADLPTGTVISNQAFVQFDFYGPWGPAPKEQPWVNTIDAGIPADASRVKPLSSMSSARDFLVEWSGADEPEGSGIANYDVYYREDDNDGNVDAQYQLWLSKTTATSAFFPYARREHRYSFYVVATDNVGHREAAPLAADAQTTVGSALFRLGIAGDSLSDEYAEADYSYAHNWVESLAQDLDVGAQGTWGTPRDEGFEYNWAQAGATSTTLLADGQHTGLAQQITAGLIDYAVLAIGQNDFGPWTEAYLGIYSGTWSPAQTDAYVNQVVANIETALQTLAATGGKLVLSNVIDYGIAPLTRFWLADPVGRERVTEAIRRVNTQLFGLAQQYNVPLIDGFQATKDFLGSNAATMDTIAIGGVEFVNAAGVEPRNMFVDDGIHPHTVGQAVIANLVVEAIRLGYGQVVGTLSFTEREMLELVGLGDQYAADTLGLVYSDYVILPGPPGGITVSPINRPTTEPNGTGTFTIALNTQPLADVMIALRSSDATEGTVSPSSVTFTPGNWNVPQAVTVTGVDDEQVDGDVGYTIVTGPAVSTDGRYNGLDAADVAVTNLDNDPHPWQNPRHWADVDDNGRIEPSDVLALINVVNIHGNRDLLVSPPPLTRFLFLDPSGDDWLTPADVLGVINDINIHGSRPAADEPAAEGESGKIPAAESKDLAPIPAAEEMRKVGALAGSRAAAAASRGGEGGSAATRAGDERWRIAVGDRRSAAAQGARRKEHRDPTSSGRSATRRELDELGLASGGSFELEDTLSEIVPDIATVWQRGIS